MNQTKPITVNHFDSRSCQQCQQVLADVPLILSKDLGGNGVKFDYYQSDAAEAFTHVHEHHVIGLILSKIRSERKIDNIYHHESVNPGSVVAIPARAEHWSAWDSPSKFAVLSIQPQALRKIAPETVNPDKIELLPAFAKPKPDALIASIGNSIKQQLQTDPDGCDFYVEHLKNALLAHLLKNYCAIEHPLKSIGNGLSPYKLKQAIEYINDNLDCKISLKDIANLVDISQYYFCHLFQNSTGVSPYKYVIQQRVAKAKDLIKNSKLSLVDIAGECGFSSQSQMTQHFRKCVGVTPKVYRDKL